MGRGWYGIGHSAAGASSIVDGLVIDLSRHFAGVEVVLPSEGSSEGGWEGAYVKCGGGSRWKDVDGAGMKHGAFRVLLKIEAGESRKSILRGRRRLT